MIKEYVSRCLCVLLFCVGFAIAPLEAEEFQIAYDIAPGSAGSSPSQFAIFQGKMYFQAGDGWGADTHGVELWVYDGVNPPSMVADLNPYEDPAMMEPGSSAPRYFCVFNGKLYFSAYTGLFEPDLWQYDGVNPPVLVSQIFPGYNGHFAKHLTVFNGKMYFSADDMVHGEELWEFNGVDAPVMSADAAPGSDGSYPGWLTVYNDKLYYQAVNIVGNMGWELYVYDGVNPPALAADINPGSGSSNVSRLTVFNGKLVFIAHDGVHGYELYEYSGTGVPVMLADICQGIQGSNIGEMIEFNGKLYFSARDGWGQVGSGNELYVYDGANPPYMVADIYPGSNSSHPQTFAVYKNKLYFNAADPVYGQELYRYDGVNPPEMVADTAPGTAWFSMDNLFVFNDKLYFSGYDNIYGYELWVYSYIEFAVTTSTVSGITAQSALCGGEVAADTGTNVTARGVCWSTSPTPTLEDFFTEDGTGTGVFTSSLTGLEAGTTYYVRAYASTAGEIVYGEELSFITPATIEVTSPAPGSTVELGKIMTISWIKLGTQDENVSIQLLQNDTPVVQIAATAFNSGAFSWGVPGDLATGSDYRIRVSTMDEQVTDDSAVFSIAAPVGAVLTVTAPTQSETLVKGQTSAITWVKYGSMKSKVRIWLYQNGKKVMKVCNVTPNNGSFVWTVSSRIPAASNYILLVETMNHKVFDYSDPFVITE